MPSEDLPREQLGPILTADSYMANYNALSLQDAPGIWQCSFEVLHGIHAVRKEGSASAPFAQYLKVRCAIPLFVVSFEPPSAFMQEIGVMSKRTFDAGVGAVAVIHRDGFSPLCLAPPKLSNNQSYCSVSFAFLQLRADLGAKMQERKLPSEKKFRQARSDSGVQ
jgi:hypothetical protein